MPVHVDRDEGEQVEPLGDGLQKVSLLEVEHGAMQIEGNDEYRIKLKLLILMRSIKDEIVRTVEERITALVLHQLRQYHKLIVEVQKETAGSIECNVPYQASELFALKILDVRRFKEELTRRQAQINVN